jgi:hypothetical protein
MTGEILLVPRRSKTVHAIQHFASLANILRIREANWGQVGRGDDTTGDRLGSERRLFQNSLVPARGQQFGDLGVRG